MPDIINLELDFQEITTVKRGAPLKRLVFNVGDTQNASNVEITLAPLDEAGNWSKTALPVILTKEDKLLADESDPEKHLASLIQSLTLGAIVPENHPLVLAYNLQGLSVKDASKVLIPILTGVSNTEEGDGI